MRGWILSLAMLAAAPGVQAADVAASPPQALSVTVYRDPDRSAGSIDLDELGGFALITETRVVHLPAGESRLRFEGVVDGIEPASAIITGLPDGVIEKNRDAAVLSPDALIRAAVGSDLTLVRTDRKTGKVTRTRAVIRSASEEGVVFQTADGVETLRCSGLPETFRYDRVPAGLSSTPTLSALTRTKHEVTAKVQLSYLASGFDWAANYVARLNPDGKTLNLGAWITLANSNSVSLPRTQTQIVAGRLNRVDPGADPSSPYRPKVVARCWPQGTTSDRPRDAVSSDGFSASEVGAVIVTAEKRESLQMRPAPVSAFAPPPAPPPPPEQLGDLKLYRVPQATTIAAMESKQVRLLDQTGVAFTRLCIADLPADSPIGPFPASVMLRTRNTLANHLGLPLPSGGVAVFDQGSDRALLVGQVDLHDTAVDEDVELTLGGAPDVQVRQTRLQHTAAHPQVVVLAPTLALAFARGLTVDEVEITNARETPVAFELRLRTYGTARVVAADQPMAMKDGRPIFRLTLPANGSVKVRYTLSR